MISRACGNPVVYLVNLAYQTNFFLLKLLIVLSENLGTVRTLVKSV